MSSDESPFTLVCVYVSFRVYLCPADGGWVWHMQTEAPLCSVSAWVEGDHERAFAEAFEYALRIYPSELAADCVYRIRRTWTSEGATITIFDSGTTRKRCNKWDRGGPGERGGPGGRGGE